MLILGTLFVKSLYTYNDLFARDYEKNVSGAVWDDGFREA